VCDDSRPFGGSDTRHLSGWILLVCQTGPCPRKLRSVTDHPSAIPLQVGLLLASPLLPITAVIRIDGAYQTHACVANNGRDVLC
jgi:hypothetical protein